MALILMPISSRTWLNVSDAEWYASAYIEALPVKNAAMNFVMAIPRLPNSAA